MGLLLLAWLNLSGSLLAQKPLVKRHSLPQPWSASRIEALYADPAGLVWLGGDFGLAAYDGIGFQFFSHRTTPRIVTAITMDHEGTIWAGHSDGSIGRCMANGDTLEILNQGTSGPQAPIIALAHQDGELWIASYGDGVWLRKGGRLERLSRKQGLPSDEPYTLAADAQGRIWMGSDEGLVEIVRDVGGRPRFRDATTPNFPDRIVKAILPHPDGSLWLGFHTGGFARYEPNAGLLEVPFPDWNLGPVESLAFPAGDELWIGTADEGIRRYDRRLGKLSGTDCGRKSLPSRIGRIIADGAGNIWASSRAAGLWSVHRALAYASGTDRKVQAVLVDPSGAVWAGTDQGLWRLDYGQDCGWTWPEKPTHLAGLNVISMALDRNNALWAGTFGQGIARIDLSKGSIQLFTERDGLPNGNILSIRSEADTLWLTTLGGIITLSWNDRSGKPLFDLFSERVGLPSPFVYTSHRSRDGTLWFGTDGKGLAGVAPSGRILAFREAEGLPLHTVYALCDAGPTGMLVGTDRGLLGFDGRRFTTIPVLAGSSDAAVTALTPLADGRVLVSFDQGLVVFAPSSGKILPIHSGADKGPLDPNLHALAAADPAHAWIGTGSGIVRIALPPADREAIPLSLRAEGSGIHRLADGARLAYSDNTLTFHFTGVWYADPDAVRYRHILEGYEQKWRETRDRQVIFTRLLPGRYVFRVQAATDGSFRGAAERSFSFEIAAPIYSRWWFILLAVLVSAALVFAGVRSRDSRIRKQDAIRRERLEMQFEVLKSQINPHFLFNSLNSLLAIIEKDPREAALFVEDLSAFFRSVLTFRERESIPLQEELSMARHYGRLLFRRFGKALTLEVEVKDMRGLVIPLTLQLLVENAVKHNVASMARPLTVRIFREGDRLFVSNNRQARQSVEPSTGLGIQNLRAQYQLLGGKPLEVHEAPDAFTVSVPILPEP